ncbi:extracellular solute-binding protein [Neobacillus sp. Marseille-QA0830]
MKGTKRKMAAVTAALCLSLVVTACTKETSTNTKQETNSPNSTSEKDPQFGKYDKPITLTTVRSLDPNMKFIAGEDLDHNIWTKDYQNELGIKIKNVWSVDSSQYESKLNVTIASGDLPDFFYVNGVQLKQLSDSGQIMDLTSYYKKYSSPLLKQFAEQTKNGISSSTFNGKLMGFAAGGATLDSSPVIWIRNDWLKKLNLSAPETVDDVLNISKAFTKNDPDGNGKQDTYGFTLQKDLFGQASGSLEGFFNGFHAYPQQWIQDSKGNLVYGSIQPEMKEALAKLQEMYKNGEIDKEFGVKDATKEGELIASGKIGMTYGTMPLSLMQLGDNKKNDPNADWQAYKIVSADKDPALAQIPSLDLGSYLVVSKKAKHPEAVFKMLNVAVKYMFDPSTPPDVWTAHSQANGNSVWQYTPVIAAQPEKNLKIHQDVVAALSNKDPKGLTAEELDAYKHSVNMEEGNGDVTDWGFDKVFGPQGSYEVINQYVQNNGLHPNGFFGPPTETMTTKQSILKQQEIETFTKIIMGESVDSFDKFVKNWKSSGGDQLTKEVNDWAKSK